VKPTAAPPIEVTIEKLVYGGDGLARDGGRVVLLPLVLPGERVRARVERSGKDLLRARAMEILEPSAGRIAPECPHFGVCGGCQYQQAAYDDQLRWKRDILAEVLKRVGKIEVTDIGVAAGAPWGYRNRAQVQIERGSVGYYEAGSHRCVAIERCPVASPALERAILSLGRMSRESWFPSFIRTLEIFTDEERFQVNVRETAGPRPARRFFQRVAETLPGADRAAIEYRVASDVFRVSPRSFFQVNRFLIERLVEIALDGAVGGSALDLYAGAGLFTLPLARRFRSVSAVENNSSAHGDLVFNARRAGLDVRASHSTAGAALEAVTTTPDFVLADPPRAGIGKEVVGHLIRLRPPRLAIVSCEPPTLARDLAPLLASGYRLERLTMIDLFPQTAHIESVARLAYTS
jgi:23S rRNA (uracil1939-C5)-methyltransferase